MSTHPKTDHRTRDWELRYSSEYYSNALYSTHRDHAEALQAKRDLIKLLHSYGFQKVAGSVEIS